jgi:hypothetical protein
MLDEIDSFGMSISIHSRSGLVFKLTAKGGSSIGWVGRHN